jgi:hypothetical protein
MGFRKEVGQGGFARSSWLPANCVYGAMAFDQEGGETRCFCRAICLIYLVLQRLCPNIFNRLYKPLSDCLLPIYILTGVGSVWWCWRLENGEIIRWQVKKQVIENPAACRSLNTGKSPCNPLILACHESHQDSTKRQ